MSTQMVVTCDWCAKEIQKEFGKGPDAPTWLYVTDGVFDSKNKDFCSPACMVGFYSPKPTESKHYREAAR